MAAKQHISMIKNLDTASSHSSGERRQLTIVHLDVVNSTVITSQIDPEEWQELIHKIIETIEPIVEEHKGKLAGFTGDGIEIYFSDEDAPSNALNTALTIKESLTQLPINANEYLKVRLGVATGNVVVEQTDPTSTGKSSFAFGLSAPLAARLQEAAPENSIYVDELTANICALSFAFETIGKLIFKGMPYEVETFSLISYKASTSRFKSQSRQLSTFIGREPELKKLITYLNELPPNSGQVVGIVGEPGIGKSRLVHELLATCKNSTIQVLLQCASTKSTSAFSPFLEYILLQSGANQEASTSSKVEKVADYFYKYMELEPSEEVVLFSFLGLDHRKEELSKFKPDSRQNIFRKVLARFLKALSAEKVLLLVIEDIHWIDPTTKDFIEDLKNLTASLPIFLVLTSRNEQLSNRVFHQFQRVELKKLEDSKSKELIQTLNASNLLTTNLVSSIQERSGGNPLYIEELTKMLVEQTEEALASVEIDKIPESLFGVLMSQLDRIPEAKYLIQLASTFGRNFKMQALAQLTNLDSHTVESQLKVLEKKDIIFKDLAAHGQDYIFKHTMIQEVAYNSQLNKTKMQNHKLIADHYIENDNSSESQPETIAHHLEHAKEFSLSVEYWIKAGTNNFQNGATREAVGVLNRAQGLIKSDQSIPLNTAVLRDYYLVRAKALNASEGAKSTEAVDCYAEAASLSEKLDDTDTQIHAIDSQFAIVFNTGKVEQSLKLANYQYKVGRSKSHIIGIISGLQSLGMTEFVRGNFDLAKQHLEHAVSDSNKLTYGLNCFPSLSLMYLALTTLLLGDKNMSKKHYNASIKSAGKEASYSLMVALTVGCYYYYFTTEFEKIRENANRILKLATDTGHHIYINRAVLFLNWCDVMSGVKNRNIEIEKEIDLLINSGEEIEVTLYLGLLGSAFAKTGDLASALKSIEKANSLSNKNGEYFFLAELYRIQAGIFTKEGNSDRAKTLLGHSIDTAKKQNALHWA